LGRSGWAAAKESSATVATHSEEVCMAEGVQRKENGDSAVWRAGQSAQQPRGGARRLTVRMRDGKRVYLTTKVNEWRSAQALVSKEHGGGQWHEADSLD
jgi:hypothetical protein